MLSVYEAERLAEKYLLDRNTVDGAFFFAHTKGVVSAIKIISPIFNLDVNKLTSLAWIHDIGYFSNDIANHAENTLSLLSKENIELDEIDKDCILNHGNRKIPLTREGRFMQVADKISILNEEFLKVLFSKKSITSDEIQFIKMMCDSALEKLENLNKIEDNKND